MATRCTFPPPAAATAIAITVITVMTLLCPQTCHGQQQQHAPLLHHNYQQSSSHQLQDQVHSITARDIERLNREAIDEVKKVFQSRMQKFDDFFRDLLKSSKRDFHTMFLQTYGLLYERNSYIFTDMFQQLERYYSATESPFSPSSSSSSSSSPNNNKGIELEEVLDSFFHRLYSKMFQVLNAQYTFDEEYLSCVSEKMEELKPFGDIPKKLKNEVKRSFVATRTFVQSVNAAADLLDRVADLPLSPDCGSVVSVFSSCPTCTASSSSSSSDSSNRFGSSSFSSSYQSPVVQGTISSSSSSLLSLHFCPSVCPIALSKCLSPVAQVSEDWNQLVQALLNLIGRLETSFNIESVVDPIDIKISEAIMNFQENGIEVSHKLFDACGKPRIGKRDVTDRSTGQHNVHSHSHSRVVRSRSFSSSVPIDSTRYNRQSSLSSSPLSSSSSSSAASSISASSVSAAAGVPPSPGASIERLLEDVKRKVKRSKDYWIRLPTVICSHRKFASLSYSQFPGDHGSQATAAGSGNCWNGSAVVTERESVSSSLSQSSYSNVGGSSRRRQQSSSLHQPSSGSYGHHNSPVIVIGVKEIRLRLKLLTRKLNYAFNGLDFKWTDEYTESEFLTGNGSGSGDSESDDDDDNDDDEDDEDGGGGRRDEENRDNTFNYARRYPSVSSSSSTRRPSLPSSSAEDERGSERNSIDTIAGSSGRASPTKIVTLEYDGSKNNSAILLSSHLMILTLTCVSMCCASIPTVVVAILTYASTGR